MSKTPKKTAKPSLKKVAKKAAPKAKKAVKKAGPKAAAKPKLVAKNLAPKADNKTQGSRRGFMWKLLEEKQQRLKEQNGNIMSSANPQDRFHPQNGQHGFARFNGPRRRVG